MLIEHAQTHQIKSDSEENSEDFADKESSDEILIDNNGDIKDVEAWGTVWYSFMTRTLTRPLRDFGLLNASETAVRLRWRNDRCATDGYSLTLGRSNGNVQS